MGRINNKISWSGYDWLTNERWGYVHPDKPLWWYDSEQVFVDSDGYLHLKTESKINVFDEFKIKSPIAAGLVSNTKEFGYGTFEIEAKLPKGFNLWPAFWMYSWYSWPPEIDVLEGYSDNNDDFSYKKNFLNKLFKLPNKYNIQTNVHFRSDGTNNSLLGNEVTNGVILKINPVEEFIKYTCVWEPNIIQIFYDNVKVREVRDTAILDKLKGHKMNIIINNGVTSMVNIHENKSSDFIVKYFHYHK